MAKCDYCSTFILFGGVRDGRLRFCNDSCHQSGYALVVAEEIPEDIVDNASKEIHQGRCPKCQGEGPIDVFTSHKVWSLILFTSWSSSPEISCKSCGRKAQFGNLLFSLIFGWWGFPWGIIYTPIQISKNIIGMLSHPGYSRPSEELKKNIRINIAAQMLEEQAKDTV